MVKELSTSLKLQKHCSKCKRAFDKVEENFYRQGEGKFASICKKCQHDKSFAGRLEKAIENGNYICRVCENELPLTSEYFSVRSENITGFQNTCKKCKSNHTQKHRVRKAIKDDVNDVLQSRLVTARSRCKSTQYEFNITLEDLKELWDKQKGKCAISGIEMTHKMNSGKIRTNVSLDRIDSSKGYIQGNVQLVCHIINGMKSDLEYNEFLHFCEMITIHNKR